MAKTNADMLENLKAAQDQQALVRVERSGIDPHSFDGFVMASNAALTLLAVVSGDIRLNGYSVLRTRDITTVDNPAPHADFQTQALALRDEHPVFPDGIDVADMKHLISSLAGRYPLVTINRERIDPDICYIGRLRMAGDSRLMLSEIDPDARWYESPAEFRYDDITRVDFGTAYEDALNLVASAGTTSTQLDTTAKGEGKRKG